MGWDTRTYRHIEDCALCEACAAAEPAFHAERSVYGERLLQPGYFCDACGSEKPGAYRGYRVLTDAQANARDAARRSEDTEEVT